MRRVFKYALPVEGGDATLRMPPGPRLLFIDFQRQGGFLPDLFLWVEVDDHPDVPDVDIELFVAMTGEPLPERPDKYLRWVASAQFVGASPYVVHLYRWRKTGPDTETDR
jgi:hypothetical protein